jgi:hypothetical protein
VTAARVEDVLMGIRVGFETGELPQITEMLVSSSSVFAVLFPD